MSDAREEIPRRLAVSAMSIAVVGLAAAYVFAWVPVWPCALIEHFRMQLLVLGILATAAAAALRVRGYFDAAAITTLLAALPVTADLSVVPSPVPANGAPVRVLFLNVHTESTSYDRVRALIADEAPDVIGLVEVDQTWLDALAPALAGYPARIVHPRTDNFGVALFARGTVTGEAVALGDSPPSIVADVALTDTRLALIVTHPLPPMNGAALDRQLAQLEAVGDRARALPAPVLVVGDLNATPWSRPFHRLVARSGLRDTRAGFGVQASYPASSRLLRIPIDHALASSSIGVRDRRIGPDVGSDHLPVILDLVVPRR